MWLSGVHSARLTVTEVSECSEPGWRHAAATPQTHQQAGRRTGRQITNKQTGCIYSLSAYASSQQAAWPDTPWRQTYPEHVVFIMWHPQVCILQVQAFKWLSLWKWRHSIRHWDTASGIDVLWSLQVNHSLFSTFWKGVHVGMFISHG